MHWAEQYIGVSWSATGEGPDNFHCWSFVRHIQKKHFGRILPGIPNPEDVLAIARGFRDHPERKRWDSIDIAKDGDCVLMRQARYPIHVGVWLAVDGGGVLHCSQEAGVVFQALPSLDLGGWQVEGFYRFTGSE
jgi:cell wall-associated NlpC family hydrolase